MSDLKDIRMAFEEYGYEQLKDVVVASRGDIWYRHSSSTEQIEHFAYLNYKPKAKAYSVDVGVQSPRAHQSVAKKLPSISHLIDPGYLAVPFLIDRPCWHMFDAGRFLKWKSIYVIPDPKQRGSWPDLFESLVRDFIEPIFFSINDPAGVRDLLLRNDAPFEWFAKNPVLRMAEIITTSRESGLAPESISETLRILCESIAIDTGNIYPSPRVISELLDNL